MELSSCRSILTNPPEQDYRTIWDALNRGDLEDASVRADKALQRYSSPDSEWHWKFATVKAEVLVRQRLNTDALAILKPELPAALSENEVAIWRDLTRAMAHCYLSDFSDSQRELQAADLLARSNSPALLGEVYLRKGTLAFWLGHDEEAEANYREALSLSRRWNDSYLQVATLGSLALVATRQGHYDESIDWNTAALRLAETIGAGTSAARILGNLGWSYFELGDYEVALDFARQAAEAFNRAGTQALQVNWLINVGAAQIYLRNYAASEQASNTALQLARRLGQPIAIAQGLNNLANVALATGEVDQAAQFNEEALNVSRQSGDLQTQAATRLIAGRIEVRKRNFGLARRTLSSIAADATLTNTLRWEARTQLASVYQAEGLDREAEIEFAKAIRDIETAQSSIASDALKLSFLSSAISLYDAYTDFLISRRNGAKALQIVEESRARTLAAGLASGEPVRSNAALHPEAIARRLHATLLMYWLGEKHSYLWVITPARTTLVALPPAGEIEPLVKSYRQQQAAGADVLHTAAAGGEELYELLVAPAKKSIPAGSRVVVLPDGALYTLNFETLIVPEPQPHFWIEDATLTTANSLTLLASGAARPPATMTSLPCKPGTGFSRTGPSSLGVNRSACADAPSLLLVGDALQASAEFPPLHQAPKEMALIENYFPPDQRAVLSREKATASAYLASHPERYSYLHFVAHGTASRPHPLESAVILSPENSEGDAYKLYAREIVKHRLNAQLVTISACNGSGTRAYFGEGLVGLSEAFLRAGAHNVIGALWEVSDTATPELMNQMYSELAAGKDPATALRDAKLKFLHSGNVFAKPFYWAPFQLYSGS